MQTNLVSYCGRKKKLNRVDSRNNWVEFMFKTKCGYQNFRKQSHINTCTAAFRNLERFGFQFDEIGFGGNHLHFLVDIPKDYSVQNTEIMLKCNSAHAMFEAHPGFRKRYPRGAFWSGYEHHQSAGLQTFQGARAYIQSQPKHHNVTVIDDTQTIQSQLH